MPTSPFNLPDNYKGIPFPNTDSHYSSPIRGTAIRGNTVLDPDSLFKADGSGLDLTTALNYKPNTMIRSIFVKGGAGQISVIVKARFFNGSIWTETFTLEAGENKIIEGLFIGIYGNNDTTATGVFPLF